ncbi:MAG: RNA polymerase sigma factor [Muribaculaceae bacterium]|nr:RNA polymerase sigma factor [Muribaculaceae bacterium]
MNAIKGNSHFQTKLLSIQSNLLNFAYLLTSNRDDAYDLLQDTTLKVLDNQDKYVDNVNFKGWVFTIMRNIFNNNYRKTMRSNTMLDNTEDLIYLNMPQDSGIETPEGSLAAGEITDVINSFPDDYRVPFSMHVSGYKYTEIAEHTGLPLGTVKSRIFFARQRLQKALADYRG